MLGDEGRPRRAAGSDERLAAEPASARARMRQTNGVASEQRQRRAAPQELRTIGRAEARQIEAADIEKAPPGKRCSAARTAGLQDADIPEDDLDELRRVAHELDEDERDVAHQPIRRQPHDADQQAEQRRRDDARRPKPAACSAGRPAAPAHRYRRQANDEMERNVETGEIGQKAEAEVHVAAREILRQHLERGTRRPPRRRAAGPIGRSRACATGD